MAGYAPGPTSDGVGAWPRLSPQPRAPQALAPRQDPSRLEFSAYLVSTKHTSISSNRKVACHSAAFVRITKNSAYTSPVDGGIIPLSTITATQEGLGGGLERGVQGRLTQ